MRRFPTLHHSENQKMDRQPVNYVDGQWRKTMVVSYGVLTAMAVGAVGTAANDLVVNDGSRPLAPTSILAVTIIMLHGMLVSIPVFRGYPLLGENGALIDPSSLAAPETIAALVGHVLMTAAVVLWILLAGDVYSRIALGLGLVLLVAMALMVFAHWRGRRLTPPAGVSGRSVWMGTSILILFPVVSLGFAGLLFIAGKTKSAAFEFGEAVDGHVVQPIIEQIRIPNELLEGERRRKWTLI